jgi:hypothetical protein
MANPRAKAERSKAKDKRQMPAKDCTPKRAPGKKDKPVVVEYRHKPGYYASTLPWGVREWTRYGRYRTVDEARTMIENCERKHGFYEYRIVT